MSAARRPSRGRKMIVGDGRQMQGKNEKMHLKDKRRLLARLERRVKRVTSEQ